MLRSEKILFKVEKEKLGLEIGPSHNPIAPKNIGYNVHIIDHLDKEGLKEKYASHNVNLDNIEEVDYIWNGEKYTDLLNNAGEYNWIIASHIIEHTPNIIGFLQECENVLNENGVLSLVVPDARFCFDYFRSLSTIGDALDAHLENRIRHTPGNIFEYHLNVAHKGKNIAWSKGHEGSYSLIHPVSTAKRYFEQSLNSDDYIDIHSWKFTPSSFRLLIHDLNLIGLLNLKEDVFFDTTAHEFYLTLSKQGKGYTGQRLDLLNKMKQELNNN